MGTRRLGCAKHARDCTVKGSAQFSRAANILENDFMSSSRPGEFCSFGMSSSTIVPCFLSGQ